MALLDALTNKQKRGFNFVAKQRNNAQTQGRTNWTGEEIATEILSAAGDGAYQELLSIKARRVYEKLEPLSSQEQNALLSQIGVNSED